MIHEVVVYEWTVCFVCNGCDGEVIRLDLVRNEL